MKVNMSVEPLVREAFAATLAQDVDRSEAALRAIADAGEQAAQDAVNLAGAVSAFALFDLHDGECPDDDQLGKLADSFVDMAAWTDIDRATALAFLTALADQRPVSSVLPPDKTAWTSFNVGVWLLAAFGPEDRKWYTYLDQILKSIETAQNEGR